MKTQSAIEKVRMYAQLFDTKVRSPKVRVIFNYAGVSYNGWVWSKDADSVDYYIYRENTKVDPKIVFGDDYDAIDRMVMDLAKDAFDNPLSFINVS